jgi:hypothetical protein
VRSAAAFTNGLQALAQPVSSARCPSLVTVAHRQPVSGRNGGHLTAAKYSDFVRRTSLFGTSEALKCLAIERHTVSSILSIVEQHKLAEKVDLVRGGHLSLFFSEQELAEIEADVQAARIAGAPMEGLEFYDKQRVEKVRAPKSCLCTYGAERIIPVNRTLEHHTLVITGTRPIYGHLNSSRNCIILRVPVRPSIFHCTRTPLQPPSPVRLARTVPNHVGRLIPRAALLVVPTYCTQATRMLRTCSPTFTDPRGLSPLVARFSHFVPQHPSSTPATVATRDSSTGSRARSVVIIRIR